MEAFQAHETHSVRDLDEAYYYRFEASRPGVPAVGFYAENHPAPLISQDSGPYPEIFDPSRSSTFLPLSLPVSMPIQMDHRPSVLSDNSFDPRPYNLSTRYPSQHFQALSPYFSAPSPFLAPSSDYSANCASQTTQSWSPSLYQPLPPTYPVPFSSDYYPHFAPIWSPGQMDSPPPAPTYGMFASSSYSPQSIEYAPTSPFLNHLIGDFPGPSANALLHSQRGPIPCSACDTIARSQAAPDPLSSALGSGGISTIPSQNRPGTKRCAWVTDRTTNQTCNMTFQHGNALQLHCENVHIEPIQKGVAQTWCCEWQGCARQRKPLRARAALWIHVYSHTGYHVAHCQLCNAAFSDFRHLDEHMRAHSLEKPYQCVFCSEVAPNIAALTAHEKSRHRNMPFVHSDPHILQLDAPNPIEQINAQNPPLKFCPLCAKSYVKKGNLVRHMALHEGAQTAGTKRGVEDIST